jgi:hypothetical protein
MSIENLDGLVYAENTDMHACLGSRFAVNFAPDMNKIEMPIFKMEMQRFELQIKTLGRIFEKLFFKSTGSILCFGIAFFFANRLRPILSCGNLIQTKDDRRKGMSGDEERTPGTPSVEICGDLGELMRLSRTYPSLADRIRLGLDRISEGIPKYPAEETMGPEGLSNYRKTRAFREVQEECKKANARIPSIKDWRLLATILPKKDNQTQSTKEARKEDIWRQLEAQWDNEEFRGHVLDFVRRSARKKGGNSQARNRCWERPCGMDGRREMNDHP